VSDPNSNREPPASDAGGSGPGTDEPASEAGPGAPEDEVFEVIDVVDELAAMAEPELGSLEEDLLAGDPLAVELADTRRQRDDYLDALRHLQADFENYKKRVAKQQADMAARAAENLVEKLLPALDTADLAMAHGGSEEVKQVWAALIDALSGSGLERIAPDGGPFDPTRHDAVAHEPGEGGQEVAEVLRTGYVWKGRVLRPAMVKVRG
jgi:molecular chaperone GrpE